MWAQALGHRYPGYTSGGAVLGSAGGGGLMHLAQRHTLQRQAGPARLQQARAGRAACRDQVLTGTLEPCQPVLHWTEPQQLQGSSYMDLRQCSNAEASSSGPGVVANGRLLTVCGSLQSTAEAAQHSASGSIAVISTDPQQYNRYNTALDAEHTTTPNGGSSASTSGSGSISFTRTSTATSIQPSASIPKRRKGRRKGRIEQLLHSLDAAFASSPAQISTAVQPPVLPSGTSALAAASVAGAHAGHEKQHTSRRLFQRLQVPTVAEQVQSSPQAGSLDAPRQEQGHPARSQKQHTQKQQQQLRWQSQMQRVKVGAQAAKRKPASGSGLSRTAAMGPAALHRSIRQARSAADLVRLYQQQQQYMDISHTSAIMWRLAALVQRTASHRAVMTQAEGRLWARLRDKALLTVSTAQAAQLVDVLSAVHCVAAAREQHHLGWARQRPQGASSAPVGTLSSSLTPSQQQRSQQQPRSQQQQASVSSQPALQGRLGRFADASTSARSNGQSQASTSGRWHSVSSTVEAAATISAAAPTAVAADRMQGAAVAGDGNLRGAAGLPGASSAVAQSGSVAGGFATPPTRPILPRPLHSSESVLRYERELVQAVLQRSTVLMAQAAGQTAAGQLTGQASGSAGAGAAHARAQAALGQQGVALRNLLSIGSAVGRLNLPAGAGWQAAFYAATLPHLPRLQRPELAELCCAVGRMQPSRKPPAIWMTAFYGRSQVLMPNMEVSELSSLLTCVSRLPGPYPEGWVMSAVRRCGESVDVLDAPAYALVLHALGRMRQRSLRPWVQELLESSTSLLYDFSPEELSLVLRGCAMLRVAPDSDWFLEFFSQSQPQLRTASGPQLANLGWALAQLRCVPPRQWTHEWVLQLRKRLHGGGRPLGAAKAKWHGIGYAVHAKRAVAAVAAFRPSELQEWCQWLRTPMPRQRPAPARSPAPALAATEVDGGEGAPLAASAALATSAVAIMAQGEQGDEQDFLDGARPQDDSDEEDPART